MAAYLIPESYTLRRIRQRPKEKVPRFKRVPRPFWTICPPPGSQSAKKPPPQERNFATISADSQDPLPTNAFAVQYSGPCSFPRSYPQEFPSFEIHPAQWD